MYQILLECINKRKPNTKSVPIALKAIKDSIEVIHTIIHTSKLINKTNDTLIELDLELPNLERLSELQKSFPSRDFHGWIKSFDIYDPQSIIDIFIRLD